MLMLIEAHKVEMQVFNAVFIQDVVRFQQTAQIQIVKFAGLSQSQLVYA